MKGLAVLIDPEKDYRPLLEEMRRGAQPDLILIGGSTDSPLFMDACIDDIRQVTGKPIYLFPGSRTQLSAKADALLYLTVLSATDYNLLAGQQIAAAPAIRKAGLKTIPMAYILLDGGKETSVLKFTGSEPVNQTDLARITTLAIAAEMMGKTCIYLEAGSGAAQPVQDNVIRAVREVTDITLIVGGGIRTIAGMNKAFAAGADVVVVGNHFESHPEELPLFCNDRG